MATLVQLNDLTTGLEPWALGRSAAELTAGLPELVAQKRVVSLRQRGGAPISLATYRDLLSFIDPTFKGDRNTYVGIMRFIIDGEVPLMDGEGAPDGADLAAKWAHGELWRERTGDAGFSVSTYSYASPEECIDDVRSSGDRAGRPGIGLGTLVHYAVQGGYRGRLDATPAAKVFANSPAPLEALASPVPPNADAYPRPKSAAELAAGDYPRPEYVLEKFLLHGHVNLLYGDGGTGKTLLALHMAVAVAAGLPLFGLKTIAMPVLLILAEDDDGETKARLEAIAAMMGVSLADLPLHTWSLPGWDTSIARVRDDGAWEAGPFMDPLRVELARIGPCLLVLDTVSDIAALDETKRLPVNTLCKVVLTGLCREFRVTVLVNAHPSKAAMTDGSGYAGSTAWNNAVRSRLAFDRPNAKSPRRILRVAKANYGGDAELELFQAGLTFMTLAQAGQSEAEELEVVLTVVLDLVDRGVAVVRANGSGQKPKDVAKEIRQKHGLDIPPGRVLDHLNALHRHGRLGYRAGGNQARGQRAGFCRPDRPSQAPS